MSKPVNKQTYLLFCIIALLSFGLGWMLAKQNNQADIESGSDNVSNLSSALPSSHVQACSNDEQLQHSTNQALEEQSKDTGKNKDKNKEKSCDLTTAIALVEQHRKNQDQTTDQAQMLNAFLAQLELEIPLDNSEQQQSAYANIETHLIDLNNSDGNKMQLVGEYLDTFQQHASPNFAGSLLQNQQYADNADQVKLLNIMQGYTYDIYEDGNHEPLEHVIESLALYQQNQNPDVRLAALNVIDSAIDDVNELQRKITPFLNDDSPKVRQRAKQILKQITVVD